MWGEAAAHALGPALGLPLNSQTWKLMNMRRGMMENNQTTCRHARRASSNRKAKVTTFWWQLLTVSSGRQAFTPGCDIAPT